MSAAEFNSPRKLRTRRQPKSVNNINISKKYQDTVFSIPELQASILAYLTKSDLKALMETSQDWRSRVYPRLDKYGIHVQQLELYRTNVHGALHVLENTSNLHRLELLWSQLSSSDLDKVLSSAPSELAHFKIQHYGTKKRTEYEPRRTKRPRVEPPLFPEPMLLSVSHLNNLQSLQWAARGMTIHVDDILRVLQTCPRLVSLQLSLVNVVYIGHDSPFPPTPLITYFDPPSPFVPIPNTDLDTLYSGHQLQELTFFNARITDEGLLHLLGIDLELVVDRTDGRSPALVRLDVGSSGPTYKSGARILQECRRLETVDLSLSKMASLELFQGDALWPCAPFLKELSLDLKPLGMPSSFYWNHSDASSSGVPVFSAAEQRQIWNRLRSMVSLRKLSVSGYPIDFAVVDDMSFAERLESGTVQLTLRVPREEFESEKVAILARASEWAARNQGWSYRIIATLTG
ncbi:hypothetical protein BG006_006176 [Podila minutissima]|uniref:F-box domain-containing protein n=1 Tax=Podila minutissima TaxID=64525 RepID=A0A9P5SJ13_9FUNG|nr:hypothetical protein BG006_006176 [Podila minutissima]